MSERRTFTGDFRRFFGRGMAILLPSALTLWILVQLFNFLMNNVGQPINRGVRMAIIEVTPRIVPDGRLPSWFRVTEDEIAEARRVRMFRGMAQMSDERVRTLMRREKFREAWDDHWYLEASGLVVAIILIYFAGLLLGGYLGRRVYERLEALLARIPGFKQVYPHVKQVVQMIMGDTPIAFNRVVMVEYPRKGIWTVGLMTSSSLRAVHEQTGEPAITIFIPSTPTPFTGFTINVPAKEVIDLPISVEEAIRFFVTGGVLIPDSQLPPGVRPRNQGNTPPLPEPAAEPPAGDRPDDPAKPTPGV
ncbi:MAG TPA: DUF502 domain-containing protein [Phycisphaerales bacterium]|nr:DUF502 domain-containing protein [Phycisphaerales bacterium]